MSENGRYVSEDSKAVLRNISPNFMMLYEKLAREAYGNELRRWKMSQKFHLMQHLCEDVIPRFGNAKFYLTYSDEDLMRVITEICLSLHPTTVSHMAMYKWAVMFFDLAADVEIIDVSDVDSD